MKIHDLQPPEGSNKRKKRVARGIAGKGGKTAGRGTKGQKARNKVPVGFEGGQMPLAKRVPKLRGFNNPFRVELAGKVDVQAHAFSKSAEAAITAAGGTVTVLPKPWGDGRPPAKGNALTNR